MLQTAKVIFFTVYELLRENQQGSGGKIVKLPPPTQIRVNKYYNIMKSLFFFKGKELHESTFIFA